MQKTMTAQDIKAMSKRDRARFVNTLSGAKSANLVGTVDRQGRTNLSMVSSCVHLGADPALMGMVIRPRAVPRHSFENLVETGFWTINHVHEAICKQAHQSSARYPKEVSEFTQVGLTEEWIADFKAPFVKEARIRLGLKLVEVIPITHNDTEFVIGAIEMVDFPETLLRADGFLDVAQAGSMAVTGLDSYQNLKSLYRLSYAKPGKDVEEIERAD